MTGSSPCPPGSGMVETWCNDAGDCELRVVGGPTFSCDAGDSAGCTQAAQDAAEACSSGGTGHDGGTDPSASVCPDFCSACTEQCAGCTDYERAAREAGCSPTFDSFIGCQMDNACPMDETCMSEIAALTSCTCPSLLPALRLAAAECDLPFDRVCGVDVDAAIVFLCTARVAEQGCAAFESALCGNGI